MVGKFASIPRRSYMVLHITEFSFVCLVLGYITGRIQRSSYIARKAKRYNNAIDALRDGSNPIIIHLRESFKTHYTGEPHKSALTYILSGDFLTVSTDHEVEEANKILQPIGIHLSKGLSISDRWEDKTPKLRMQFKVTDEGAAIVFRLFAQEPRDPRIPIGRKALQRINTVYQPTTDKDIILPKIDDTSPVILRMIGRNKE
jgi:hypothetical protein